jgi:1,4-alpha-glucan branching enzyme
MRFVAELNRFYRESAPLWQLDFDYAGFNWLDFEDQDNSIISFTRFAKDRSNHLVCLLNFTPQTLTDYQIGLPEPRDYIMVFCSDRSEFGGSGNHPETTLQPANERYARAEYHTRVNVPPLGGLVLRPVR